MIKVGKIYTDFSGKVKYILFPYKQSPISKNIWRSLVYSTSPIRKNTWYALNINKAEKLTRVKFTSEESRKALKALFETDKLVW